MKASKIQIEAVRGFEGQHDIPLSQSLTIIYGENGRGKTSLCEAWNWLYTKDFLPGLEPRSEFGEAGANIHASGEPSVSLFDLDDAPLMKRRGEIFENTTNLPTASSPVLLQYRLQQVLFSSQGDRRAFFEALMSLDVEAALAQTLRRAAQSVRPANSDAWTHWAKAVQPVSTEGFAAAHPTPKSRQEQERNEGSLLSFLASYFECEANLEGLESAIAQGTGGGGPPIERLRAPMSLDTEEVVKEALGEIGNLKEGAEAALRRNQWRNEGLGFADPPNCPLCREPTLPESRIAEIEAGIVRLERDHEKHVTAKEKLRQGIERVLPIVSIDAGLVGASLDALPKVVSGMALPNQEELLSAIDSLKKALRSFPKKPPTQEEMQNPDVYKAFAEYALGLTSAWLALAPQLVTLEAELKKQRTRARYIESGTFLIHYFRSNYKRLYLLLDLKPVIDEIGAAAPDKVNELKVERLAKLGGAIKDFYGTLRPADHTPLESITSPGGVRGDIRILAKSRSKLVHASAVFSHSNSNALGMAAHIARVVDTGHATIILDDPFQSLDSSNRKAVVQNLVSKLLENDLQVVILTHDRSAAEDLLASYADKNARGISLSWKENEGASPEPLYPPGDAQIRIVLDGLESDSESQIQGTASALRHLIERVCSAYVITCGGTVPPIHKCSLGNFIDRMESLPTDKRPNALTIAKLKLWNTELSGEGHTGEAPSLGMEALREMLREFLSMMKQDRQLKPPGETQWLQIPKSTALRDRAKSLVGGMTASTT